MHRATRTLTVAHVCVLMGVIVACGGDDSAATSDDAGSGSSSGGGDAFAPDGAPSIGCPAGCSPPAPAGWTGPSAVWNDVTANKPASCPSPYAVKTTEAHEGLTADPATCTCPAGSVVGAKCTATAHVYTGSSASCTTKSGFNDVKVDSTTCSAELGAATDAIILAGTLTAESVGTCSYQPPTPVRPALKFAKETVACGLAQNAACEGRAECVSTPTPGGPFAKICVHKLGDDPCPSADYPVRFTAFKSVDDQRSCDATCAGTVTGTATCGTKWGFSTKASAGCTGGTTHPETLALDACITVPNATAVIDPFKLAPSGLSCALGTDTKPIGEAKSSGLTTFCCRN